ncbi:hypothetical protein BOTBODRAFT_51605 [Botryobasidium botryosum FD-172 SS1]|uniref:FAD-binding PCMH-type domain-containing protein n=1 Tax=Botryobasidium botryosum (strain FD-172 SS1) TaxID=930990 RepID=A0A067MXA6_BOTB1|nr:hypothetical protein BOTBODRAFT_51605 [Botryobasidium botryosum FD-172 SS1]
MPPSGPFSFADTDKHVRAAPVPPPHKTITEEQIQTLASLIKGPIHRRGSPDFEFHSTVFNGAVKTPACILAQPLDAQDTSRIVIFCAQHGLSPSARSGGYGTHGWAVEGDVIIDLALIDDIDMELPGPEGEYIGLRDMTPKGKAPAVPTVPPRKEKGRAVDGSNAHIDSRWTDFSGPFGAPPNVLGRRTAEEAFGPEDEISEEADERPRANRPKAESSGSVPGGGQGQGRSGWGQRTTQVPTPPMGTPEMTASSSANLRSPGEQIHLTLPQTQLQPPSQQQMLISPPLTEAASLSERTPSHAESVSSAHSPADAGSSSPLSPAPHTSSSPFSFPDAPSTSTEHAHASFGPSTTYFTSSPATPPTPYVYATFGAGARQRQVDEYSAAHPLPGESAFGQPIMVPYHVPFSAHPVGTANMLLGGFGFLTRLRGLSLDALVEVEMVLADGTIVIVNEKENSDLWWAIRGAGSAFGIAIRYKVRAYPVPVVFAGNIVYNFHKSTAASLLKHFRDCVKSAPRELYANAILTAGPRNKGALVVIQMCYAGPREHGAEFLQAISSWDGDRCLLVDVEEKQFLHQQDSVAKVLKGGLGRKWFIRSDLITTLTDQMIHDSVMEFGDTPDGCTWLFELSGGAMGDVEDSVLPTALRKACFNVVALHQWKIDENDPECVQTAERWITNTISPQSAGGPLPCLFERRENVARTISTYGSENWSRLCALKRIYDPTGMFKHTFWPSDGHGLPIGVQTEEDGSDGTDSGSGKGKVREGRMDSFLEM